MPSIFDDTKLFNEDAARRFSEAFENGVPGLSSTGTNKQSDLQKENKQLKLDIANLRHNLRVTESRLDNALSENSKLKERIEELEEVLPISPVKPPVRAIDENALIKPYLDEIAQLRAQLSEYENPDATRIVRFTRSNPVDEALKRRASSREQPEKDKPAHPTSTKPNVNKPMPLKDIAPKKSTGQTSKQTPTRQTRNKWV